MSEREHKANEKIFTKNEDALKFCASLKARRKIPFKYVIVTWDD
jgi:hypothetical protein